MSCTTLIILTYSYPYDKAYEKPFIEPELSCLSRRFDRIIVVSEQHEGKKIPLPDGIEIDENGDNKGKDKFPRGAMYVKNVISRRLWKELASFPGMAIQPRGTVRALATLGCADQIRKRLEFIVRNEALDTQKTIIYSYWLGRLTLAAAFAEQNNPGIRIVSRAHGADVYEQRKKPPWFPFREEYLKKLEKLFTVSENGRNHLVTRYPRLYGKVEIARLGVKDPGFVSKRSEDNILRIVSCSMVKPVKRLSLLARALEKLAACHPANRFEWTHIGGGKRLDGLKHSATHMPANISCRFTGHIPPEKVLRFYRDNRTDVFVNVSRSEGIPVSIMEAFSCGIPVAATRVGGTPEIVNAENGILLDPAPDPDRIASDIWRMIKDRAAIEQKAIAARQTWEQSCHADRNFSRFADSLLDMAR